MNRVKILAVIGFITVIIYSCKKEELTGDLDVLIGVWDLNYYSEGTKTIEFIEKGKYKIELDGKKIESGRVIEIVSIENPIIQLEIDKNIGRYSDFGYNQLTIVFSGDDTLRISSTIYTDRETFQFIRK
ncbi:MAG: hypothetical protein HRT71_18005 [Flavobacteriales bacterium]|nr:hypothetical protein [Flavobacteriales bacterium]